MSKESSVADLVNHALADIGQVVLGKQEQIKLALTCLFTGGHLLLEDLPGMGKTTLAKALATVLGLDYSRVQFTSDLLPSDILGVSVFDRNSSQFTFHPGPIFTQLLLADEINRTTPKTQSALLEAMEEYQVTQDGETRRLTKPFFVIATQNPASQSGTFPLPESQLDRFLMRIELGYPSQESELLLLKGGDVQERLALLKARITPNQLIMIQKQVDEVIASDSLLAYLQRLVAFTRASPSFAHGVSPRGALALLRCSKTWALIHGRNHVLPEDLQAVLPAVFTHRLRDASNLADQSGYALVEKLLSSVDVIV